MDRESEDVRVSAEEEITGEEQRKKEKKMKMKVGERKMLNLMFTPSFPFV